MENHKTKIGKILEEMRSKGSLPALNETVVEISRLARKKDTSVADLATVIMRDCGLTTNLLDTVNSAYYARRFPIKTVSSAVIFLGFEKLVLLALGLAIFKNTMGSLRDTKLLKLYASSYFSGTLAMALAREYNYDNPEEVFVAGLLYRLPRMSLANTFPERFLAMEKLVNEKNLSYNQACLKAFNVKYNDICDAILEIYNLPGIVSKILGKEETLEEPLTSLVHEAANLATMLFGDKPGGKKLIEASEEKIKTLLKRQEFSVSDFIKTTCEKDRNVIRFFNLDKDDVKMMVDILEWGKANPAEIISNLAFGEALEEIEDQMESPESLIGHFLTEIAIRHKKGSDINEIMMLAQEALWRCLGNAEIFMSFLGKNKQVLEGRFYTGTNLTVRAENFQISLRNRNSPIVQSLLNHAPCYWTKDQKPLQLPFIITQHLKFESAIIAPIVALNQAIGLFFIGRTTVAPITEREQVWIEMVVDRVEAGFEKVGSTH